MLYKRQLICYIKDNFDNLGQHWMILAYDATASTDSLSLLKCKKSCPKLF